MDYHIPHNATAAVKCTTIKTIYIFIYKYFKYSAKLNTQILHFFLHFFHWSLVFLISPQLIQSIEKFKFVKTANFFDLFCVNSFLVCFIVYILYKLSPAVVK